MNEPTELTDEQCNEFRRHNGSFNSMVRHIFKAGQAQTALDAKDAEIAALRNAVEAVCEGWTLPHDARKMLESALWPAAQAAQATLICPTCKADRLKKDCKGVCSDCGLKVVAQAVQP